MRCLLILTRKQNDDRSLLTTHLELIRMEVREKSARPKCRNDVYKNNNNNNNHNERTNIWKVMKAATGTLTIGYDHDDDKTATTLSATAKTCDAHENHTGMMIVSRHMT